MRKKNAGWFIQEINHFNVNRLPAKKIYLGWEFIL
jgi:hypothetical protein